MGSKILSKKIREWLQKKPFCSIVHNSFFFQSISHFISTNKSSEYNIVGIYPNAIWLFALQKYIFLFVLWRCNAVHLELLMMMIREKTPLWCARFNVRLYCVYKNWTMKYHKPMTINLENGDKQHWIAALFFNFYKISDFACQWIWERIF